MVVCSWVLRQSLGPYETNNNYWPVAIIQLPVIITMYWRADIANYTPRHMWVKTCFPSLTSYRGLQRRKKKKFSMN